MTTSVLFFKLRSENIMGKIIAAIIFAVVFAAWAATQFIMGINFGRNCEGYLKRAADSNTVEMATKELGIALDYMEANHLVEGYTSIVYRTPSEDIGFWYKNIKASREELTKLSKEATPLERTNVLMKLRETLLDTEKTGTAVTVPNGISLYPFNTLFALWGWGSLALTCFFGFFVWRDNS